MRILNLSNPGTGLLSGGGTGGKKDERGIRGEPDRQEEEMLEKIYDKYKEGLSKSDHKIFGYLLEHEQELPGITAEDLSRRLGISTATISRFWSKIGFQNLKELKRSLYQRQEATPYSRMNAALSQWQESGISPDMLLSRLTEQMERTFQVVKPEQLDLASELLIKARQVYLFAPDVSRGLGNILQYRLLRLGIRLISLPGGSQIYDSMVNLKSGDLVLLFGYSRLLNEVRVLLSYSREAGYKTILFTDLLTGEFLSQADLVLYTCRGEPNDYHSVAVPVLLLDLLIMKTSQALDGGLEKAKQLQKLRETYGGLIRR